MREPNTVWHATQAAMTEHLATADGAVTPPLLQLYKTWAESGAGMLLTGTSYVE